MIATTSSIKPYTALHLQHFPTEMFYTDKNEIHPMWSGEGNLSYMVVNPKTREALLIDPDLEILGSYLLTLDQNRLKLKAVIDTHNHAEHATAAPVLRQLTGAAYLMNHRAPSSQITDRLQDKDERTLLDESVRFIHQPGHTPDLQVVQIGKHLFTGDSLFISSCGRADLPGGDAGHQFDSLQRIAKLPDETVIHPGHDYNNQLSDTLGNIHKNNQRLQFTNREAFIHHMEEAYRDNEKPDDLEYYVAFNAR